MARPLEPDICVIGGGSAGLTVAAGAQQMGARTVLIERARMGGDCLNYGCVPSKSLLAAAKAAHGGAEAAAFGIGYGAPEIDFAAVHRHVHEVIAAIAPHDSQERFERLGVTVLREHARFTGPREVEAGAARVRARRFVLATGSTAVIPPVEGLDQVAYLSNESVFDLTEAPRRLVVVGAGAVGCELGQAFRRLGSEVSLVEVAAMLPAEDPELVEVVRRRLVAEGVDLRESSSLTRVAPAAGGFVATVRRDGQDQSLEGSHLLLAAGRRPVVEDLGLEAAGIAYDRHGVKVDRRLRTSNKRVFAAGDVAGSLQLTHMAGYHAGIVLRNALFRLPAKAETGAVPRVIYTAPELAHVGLTEAAARERHGEVRVLRQPFADNDRARTERATEGLLKAVVTPRGRILGASIVGVQAGELILPWVLAMAQGLKVGALARVIAPYPTLGEASKQAAGAFYTPRLFGPTTRRLVRLLARLG